MKNLELMVGSANHCYEHGIDFTVHPRLFLDVVKTLRSLVEENATLDCAIGAVVDAYEGGARDVLAEAIDAAVNVKTPVTDKVLNSLQKSSCNHDWIRSEGRTASGWLCSKCGDYDGPASAEVVDDSCPRGSVHEWVHHAPCYKEDYEECNKCGQRKECSENE